MHKYIVIIVFLLLLSNSSQSQSKWDLQLGYGYLEHFSTGIGYKINEKHKVSLLLGTNFFMNLDEFASYQIQYEYPNQFKKKYLLNFGIRGAFTNYTNTYYSWDLISITPISNIKYRLRDDIVLVATLGMSYSRVLNVKRLKMGEIGWYRELLPEMKISVSYDL